MDLSLGTLSHRFYRLLRIDRRLAARNQPVELQRHRIFILPTRYGLLFAVLVFVMLVGSANYNNSAGFLLGFLLAGMGMVTILHTYRNLAGLSFHAGRSEPVFAGDMARYSVIVHNRQTLERHALLMLSEAQSSFHDLPPRADARITIEATTLARGRRRLGPITIVSRYPLGLFRAWSNIRIEADCLVYPRPATRGPLPQGTGTTGDGRQQTTSGSDDFLGWRDYQAGDSPRRIDWKVAARRHKLYTKQFAATDGDEIWLDWDDYPADNVERRLSLLCRAVLDAEGGDRRYGMRLPGIEVPAGAGPDHRHACLEALALFEAPA